jgi:fermentation-respiration switch protein FrsA (DUF1100 family)
MKPIIIIIAAGAGIYLLIVLLAWIFQERLLYLPLKKVATTPADIGLDYESVRFGTADGLTLTGWFVPAATDNQPTLLFFHGNAGNIGHRLESITVFHRLGLNVFIVDYRGYGQSEGRPTEAGTYRDAEAAWAWLVNQRQIAPERIIIFGRSLGGGVAAYLAQKNRPAALILESTFTSAVDVAAQSYPFLPVGWLMRIQYSTQQRLSTIDCPVLIIHSPNDRVIPYPHGQQLYAAANEPKQFLQINGGHNDGFVVSNQVYETGVAQFINQYVR